MSSHENTNHNIKNNSIIYNANPIQTELKLGEYFLTPLESFLINKSMPHGFKLELMENYIKFSDLDSKERKKNKKNKNQIKSQNNSYNHINHNNTFNHKNEKKEYPQIKRRTQDLNLDNNYNGINREKYKIAKKCQRGMQRIKDSQFGKNFYEFNDLEIPSLSKVEKKLNNYEYESFYDFEMDIRKIWSYFFYLGEKGDQDIYEKTSKMSEIWENICSELENSNDDIYETVSNSVIRRAEKNRKEILERKQNSQDKINKENSNSIKEDDVNININIENGRTLTREEKNRLGILIKHNLNIEQLKGIAKIIMGNDNIKTLEFDIDQLSYDKLNQLEKFVNECVEKNNLNNNKNGTNLKNKNNNVNNKQINKGKENEINNRNKINNEENGMKKLENKKEQSSENIENKVEIKKDKEENKNKENKNNNNNVVNNKNMDSLSDSDSLSSDSSLSD